MFRESFKASKLKAQLQVSESQIRVVRTRKENDMLCKRREVAKLLRTGQEASARIRVEASMREKNTTVAYQILELYCNLLVKRIPEIESQRTCPADIKEAVASLVFAAPRCGDLSELMLARNMLATKYGKDFIVATEELRPECGVNKMIINKLSMRTPTDEEKLAVLKEIAAEQKVEWDSSEYERMLPPSSDTVLRENRPGGPGYILDPSAPTPAAGGGVSLRGRAAATVAAAAAHSIGQSQQGSEGLAPSPPPPPFQNVLPSAPGMPKEMFLQGPQRPANGLAATPALHASHDSSASQGQAGSGNPLSYPRAPNYLDGYVLPKGPLDYAHEAVPAEPGSSEREVSQGLPSVEALLAKFEALRNESRNRPQFFGYEH